MLFEISHWLCYIGNEEDIFTIGNQLMLDIFTAYLKILKNILKWTGPVLYFLFIFVGLGKLASLKHRTSPQHIIQLIYLNNKIYNEIKIYIFVVFVNKKNNFIFYNYYFRNWKHNNITIASKKIATLWHRNSNVSERHLY